MEQYHGRDGRFTKAPRLGKDLSGRTFGRLRVIRSCGSENGDQIWLLLCSCKSGKTIYPATSRLLDNNKLSCGCLNREHMARVHELNTEHGHARMNGKKSLTYSRWEAMIRRTKPDSEFKGSSRPTKWEYFGGATPPVRCCPRWKGFANFLADLGEVPSPAHTLSRLADTGDYRPGNAVWGDRAHQQEQARIKRERRKRKPSIAPVYDVNFDDIVARVRKEHGEEDGITRTADQADEVETADEILAHFEYVITYKFQSAEMTALATALRDELVARFETVADPVERLAIARKARGAYRAACNARATQ